MAQPKADIEPDPLAVSKTEGKGHMSYEVRGSDGLDYLRRADKGEAHPTNYDPKDTPFMGAGSDIDGVKVIERRGGLPNNEGSQPHGGEQRMELQDLGPIQEYGGGLSPQVAAIGDKKTDADVTGLSQAGTPEFGAWYDELAKLQKEQEVVNSVQSWTETGRGKLPSAKSPTGDDTPRFDVEEGLQPSQIGDIEDSPGFLGDITPSVNPSND